MRRGLKRANDEGDVSEVDSVNSRTVKLPLPENLDCPDSELDGNDAAFGDKDIIDFDEYSVGSQIDSFAEMGEAPSFLNQQESANLKSLIDDSCL